jgi:hypothetical protein
MFTLELKKKKKKKNFLDLEEIMKIIKRNSKITTTIGKSDSKPKFVFS